MTYATITDVRLALGASSPTVEDARITTAINVAGSLIDGYTSSAFGAPAIATRVFTDVRTKLVVLPPPFSNITRVAVAGYVLVSDQWEVETWGLRLFPAVLKDASGLPLPVGSDQLGGWTRMYGHLGLDVSVTATWGWTAVPVAVQQATILLALDYLNLGSNEVGQDPRIRSLSVEGFSVSLADAASGGASTGNVMADRLLAQYRETKVGAA